MPSRRATIQHFAHGLPRAPAPLDGHSRALPENAKHAGDRIRDRAVNVRGGPRGDHPKRAAIGRQPTKSPGDANLTSVHPEIPPALAVLEHALDNCRENDMRTPEVIDAIKLFLRHADSRHYFVAFWHSLAEPNIEGRWQTANAALNGIKLAVGMTA